MDHEVDLNEKLAMQLAMHKDPVLVMNQMMVKRLRPNLWPVPDHGTTYIDEKSGLTFLIDNNTPPDRLDIMDKED